MTRFNGVDSRLDRSLECALLLMEASKSFEHKFQYTMSGHSGDGPNIEFIKGGKYPSNEKERFNVMHRMHDHASFCLSGDSTLSATIDAINHVSKQEDVDDRFVIVFSDANLPQYNISAENLKNALYTSKNVSAFIIFIGFAAFPLILHSYSSLQDQADSLVRGVGARAQMCLRTKDLPACFKNILRKTIEK